MSERCEHRDESVVPICQREDAEPVEGACSIGDGGKQLLEVVLVDALWEEGNNSKKRSGIGAKFLEHREGEGKLDRCGEALVTRCLQHARSTFLPFSCQSVHAPLFWRATVASRVIESGWKSSCFRISLIRPGCL